MPDRNESFIPKKGESGSSSKHHYAGGKRLNLVAFLAFLLAFAVCAGLFFYKKQAQSKQAKAEQELIQARQAFEPELINELDKLAKTINTAETLVNEHTALTPLFPLIEETTLKSVQFSSMEVSISNESTQTPETGDEESSSEPSLATVSLTGTGPGYASVALQLSEIVDHDQLLNPVLSEYSLTEEEKVDFSIEFSVPQSELRYVNTL